MDDSASLHIDPLERRWVIVAVMMLALMIGILIAYSIGSNINPPSNVETIDSSALHLTEEFAEDNLGVAFNDDGSITVIMVATRYGFYPPIIEVPENTPVTFRLASFDVLHGVHAAGTNMNTMIVPGFVSEVNTAFPTPGEYPLFCNEFCGLGHDHMWGRLIVTANQ
jgi:cytochrome c oxidase subunit 2